MHQIWGVDKKAVEGEVVILNSYIPAVAAAAGREVLARVVLSLKR